MHMGANIQTCWLQYIAPSCGQSNKVWNSKILFFIRELLTRNTQQVWGGGLVGLWCLFWTSSVDHQINKVTLCRAHLVLGWVGTSPCYIPAKLVNSALHPSRVPKSSTSLGRLGWRWECYLCRVVSNTVWSEVACEFTQQWSWLQTAILRLFTYLLS